ncbi:MAG: heavy metal-associated domain-containing protein [Balneolaceae bacterium]
MTCDGCARNIDRALSKKQGIKKNQFPGRKGKQKSVMIQTPSQKRN